MTRHDVRRILILTGDAGFGHRKCAEAIASALADAYGDSCTAEIVNPLEDKRVISVLRKGDENHDRLTRRENRRAYHWGYNASQTALSAASMGGALIVMLYPVMRDVIKHYQPDAIVSTFPTYLPPLRALLRARRGRRSIPFLAVVTDLGTVHRLWFHRGPNLWSVGTETVRNQAIALGIAPERVQVTGIPVDPAIAREKRSQEEIRAALGWRQDLRTVLAVGSRRVAHLPQMVDVLNHSGLPLQLAIVAGGDDDLYAELTATEWHLPAYILRWGNDMPGLMRASDILMSKAGGLITTEALASGLPLLLIDVLPDQEQGNAIAVVQNGAGELALTPSEALAAVYHWLAEDGALLAERARAAANLGRPRAAYDVAERAWQLAEKSQPAR